MLAPPAKPEDDLSKVPIFAEVYQRSKQGHLNEGVWDRPIRLDRINVLLGAKGYHQTPKSVNFRKGEATDLGVWQKFYHSLPEARLPKKPGMPAQDVLEALGQIDPEMKEIEAAVSNPNAFWPVNYDRPSDTNFWGVTSMLQVAKVLSLRAVARLQNNEADLAAKDFVFSCRLNQPLSKSCFLVDYLVTMADRAIDGSILWEGIHRHAWSSTELRDMDSALGSDDMLALGHKALRFERAQGLQNLNVYWGRDSQLERWYRVFFQRETGNIFYSRPVGWWDQDESAYSRFIQRQIDAIHPVEGILDKLPDIPRPGPIRRLGSFLVTPFTDLSSPLLQGCEANMAEAETNRRLARVACRLEEYYLSHKQYPDKLEELGDLPAHLDQEVLTGKPLHYWRKGDSYVLYSTGGDEQDHGGTPRQANSTSDNYDWVWPGP